MSRRLRAIRITRWPTPAWREAYVLLPAYTATAPQDAYPKAKSAALKALQLDDKLAEAHYCAWRLYCCFGDLDMAGSISEFQHAIALNPNYATAHHWYGNGPLLALGRFDEAIAEGKRAIELDPLSPIINCRPRVRICTVRVDTMRRSRSCARRWRLIQRFITHIIIWASLFS